jgi:DNA polymerase III alpha subunit
MTNSNKFGERIYTEEDIVNAIRTNPSIDLSNVLGINLQKHNDSIAETYSNLNTIESISKFEHLSVDQYHEQQQKNWLMPREYKELDIAKYLLETCGNNENELQRMGEELLLFQSYGLFDLLRYLKYLVDTLSKHNVLLGVGRGSSVASYALYKLKVHRIDSLYYNLSIHEFLHE